MVTKGESSSLNLMASLEARYGRPRAIILDVDARVRNGDDSLRRVQLDREESDSQPL